jgi:hypothetical protein
VERKMKIYDCEFLTSRREDFPAVDFRWTFHDAGGPPMMDMETGAEISFGMLIDMITYNIHPDTWSNTNNSIRFSQGKLVVVQTPEVLEEVDALLGVLRRSRVRMVHLRSWALKVENTHFNQFLSRALGRKSGSLMDKADMDHFLAPGVDPRAVEEVGAVSLTCFSGQRVHGGPMREIHYVRDIDVEVAQNYSISDPVMGRLLTGFVPDVRPTIVGNNDTVLLELRLNYAAVSPNIEQVESGVGLIDLPRRTHVSTRATAVVPPGKAVFYAASHPVDSGYTLVFIFKPSVMGLEKEKEKKEKEKKDDKSKPRRVLRIYNVQLITSRPENFPGPEIGRPPMGEQGAGAPAFEEPDEEGISISAEELAELIKTSIEEDSWGNVRNSISVVGNALVVVQKPEVQSKIKAFLDSIRSRRAVLIFSTLRFVSCDTATLRRLLPDGGAGLSLTAAQLASIEREIQRGKALRLVGSGCVTGFNRQRVHIVSSKEMPVIADADVEVAQGAGIGDPIMAVIRDGVVHDLVPVLTGDGRHIVMDLRPTSAKMSSPVLTSLGKGIDFKVHKFLVDEQRIRTSITVPDGGTAAFVCGPDESAPTRRALILISGRIVRVK